MSGPCGSHRLKVPLAIRHTRSVLRQRTMLDLVDRPALTRNMHCAHRIGLRVLPWPTIFRNLLCACVSARKAPKFSAAVMADRRRHVHCLDVPSSVANMRTCFSRLKSRALPHFHAKQSIEDQSQKVLNAFYGVVSND